MRATGGDGERRAESYERRAESWLLAEGDGETASLLSCRGDAVAIPGISSGGAEVSPGGLIRKR